MVVHFTAIFFIAAVGLVPGHRESFIAVMIGGAAIVGGGVAIFTTVELIRHDWTKYLQDHFGYGVLPVLCYVAMLVAAKMVYAGQPEAMDVLAGALLVLMIVNIRNAWDLMLSMVYRHANEKKNRKR